MCFLARQLHRLALIKAIMDQLTDLKDDSVIVADKVENQSTCHLDQPLRPRIFDNFAGDFDGATATLKITALVLVQMSTATTHDNIND